MAQSHVENHALKLFFWADSEDRLQHYNKYNIISEIFFSQNTLSDFVTTPNRNVVKAFYTAGMLLEVCSTFGELNEEIAQQKK